MIMYWYDNFKHKWIGRHQTEVGDANVTTYAATETSERAIKRGGFLFEGTESDFPDIMTGDLHDIKKCIESLNQNFEKNNKEVEKIVAKMNFNERKIENIELFINEMKKTH